jgi:hypothetical protein
MYKTLEDALLRQSSFFCNIVNIFTKFTSLEPKTL